MRNIISKPLCWLLCCLLLIQPMISCTKKPTEPKPEPILELQDLIMTSFDFPKMEKDLTLSKLATLGTDMTYAQVQAVANTPFPNQVFGRILIQARPWHNDHPIYPPCAPEIRGQNVWHYNVEIYILHYNSSGQETYKEEIFNFHIWENPTKRNCFGGFESHTGICQKEVCGKSPDDVFRDILVPALVQTASQITNDEIDNLKNNVELRNTVVAVILLAGLIYVGVEVGIVATVAALVSRAITLMGIDLEAAGAYFAGSIIFVSSLGFPPSSQPEPIPQIIIYPTEAKAGVNVEFKFSGLDCDYIAYWLGEGQVYYAYPNAFPVTVHHTFQNTGMYEIHNTAFGNGHWSETLVRYTNITDAPATNQPPVSNPSCPGTATVNQPVTITNNATDADGTVTEYRWRGEFGSYTTTTKQTDVTFSTVGSKVVYVAAKDDDGAWGQEAFCAMDVSDAPCTPEIILNCPGSVPINGTMQICWTPSCSDVTGWTYAITLDGNVWISQQTQTCVSTTFPSPGSHTVCVTLNDGKGHTVTKCCTVTIYDPIPNQAPNACFNFNPSSGTTETTFNFDAGCSTDDKTPLANLQVRWQIDGSWTAFTTTKTYDKKWSTSGQKIVVVEVKDGAGLTDQDTKTIQVDNPAPTTGIVVVNPTPSSVSWDITPGGYSGTGYQSIPDVTPGEIHINWHPLSGYDTPAGENKTLTAGKTITFSVNYTPSSTPVDFTPTAIPDAALQEYYEVIFASTGGTSGYGIWFSKNGDLPGLTFTNNADGTATLSGVPNVTGDYPFSVTLHDAGNLQNTKTRDYILRVKPLQGILAVDPAILNFGGELDKAYSTVYNAGQGSSITFNASTNKPWLTVYPTIGATRTEMTIYVNRSGLADGQYSGRVTLTSSGGTAYIDVQMTVATACVMSPDMISPVNGQSLDLSDPVFSWSLVCESAGWFYMVVVDSRSYYGNVIFWESFNFEDTYVRYTGHNLSTNRYYYWYLTDANGYPVTGIESFYVIP